VARLPIKSFHDPSTNTDAALRFKRALAGLADDRLDERDVDLGHDTLWDRWPVELEDLSPLDPQKRARRLKHHLADAGSRDYLRTDRRAPTERPVCDQPSRARSEPQGTVGRSPTASGCHRHRLVVGRVGHSKAYQRRVTGCGLLHSPFNDVLRT
jgi:hypothetical protein